MQPALAALKAAVDAIEGLAVGLFDWDGTPDDIMTRSLTPTDTSHDCVGHRPSFRATGAVSELADRCRHAVLHQPAAEFLARYESVNECWVLIKLS